MSISPVDYLGEETRRILRPEFQRTAQHLAPAKPIEFSFTKKPDAKGRCELLRIDELDYEFFEIAVFPFLTLGDTYQTLLHEIAHALYDCSEWVYPFPPKQDVEDVAWEQATVWATSIAKRNPNDINELMSWCEKLRTFGKDQQVFLPIRIGNDPRKHALRRIRNVTK